jgi:hypothetical protein
MNLCQKGIHETNMEVTVGGTEDVPPTLCPPPAHVERTGAVVSNKSQHMGAGRPVTENSLILFLEAAP